MKVTMVLMVGLGLGLATGVRGEFLETNPLPFWSGTDGETTGNPYTDGNGNQWTVYAANGANGGEGNPHFGSWDEWTKLSYSSADAMWGSGRPGFTSGRTFQADGYWSAPGLIMTVDTAGAYSWYGGLYVAAFSSPTVVFGKIVGGVWSSIYGSDRVLPVYGTLDLGTVSELQDISLNAGDALTVYIGRLGGGWTDVAMADTGIGRVHEQVSLKGTVNYEGFIGDNATMGIVFELHPAGGGATLRPSTFLHADGSFQLDGIPTGEYTLAAKSHGSLRTVVGTVTVMDNPTVLPEPIVLRGVDANGDNTVSFEDFSMLQNSYGERGANPLPAAAALADSVGGCGPLGLVMLSLLGLALVLLYKD